MMILTKKVGSLDHDDWIKAKLTGFIFQQLETPCVACH